jgi:hypothetical protein
MIVGDNRQNIIILFFMGSINTSTAIFSSKE